MRRGWGVGSFSVHCFACSETTLALCLCSTCLFEIAFITRTLVILCGRHVLRLHRVSVCVNPTLVQCHDAHPHSVCPCVLYPHVCVLISVPTCNPMLANTLQYSCTPESPACFSRHTFVLSSHPCSPPVPSSARLLPADGCAAARPGAARQ